MSVHARFLPHWSVFAIVVGDPARLLRLEIVPSISNLWVPIEVVVFHHILASLKPVKFLFIGSLLVYLFNLLLKIVDSRWKQLFSRQSFFLLLSLDFFDFCEPLHSFSSQTFGGLERICVPDVVIDGHEVHLQVEEKAHQHWRHVLKFVSRVVELFVLKVGAQVIQCHIVKVR